MYMALEGEQLRRASDAELARHKSAYLERIKAAIADPNLADELAAELAGEKLVDEEEKIVLASHSEKDPKGTGLFSPKGLKEEFRRYQSRLQRSFEQRERNGDSLISVLVSVLFIDMDDFKKVNDEMTGGHKFGDQVIDEVSKTIMQTVRPEDIVVRYGGDEMVAILIGCSSGPANKVADRLRGTVADRTEQALNYRQTLSIGVAQLEEDISLGNIGDDFLAEDGPIFRAIKKADGAMYRAKKSGKDKTAFYGPDGGIYLMPEKPDGTATLAEAVT